MLGGFRRIEKYDVPTNLQTRLYSHRYGIPYTVKVNRSRT